jgi:enamine deaminase RidA (YjgF/YER057c/UK114 family)
MKRYSWPADHWHWPVPLSHQHGVRSGNLVFTGGQADLDHHGNVIHPDALLPQCHSVVRYTSAILNDLDASMADVVRWVVYFVGDHNDEKAILDILADATPRGCRPTVSTICQPALCYPGMRIELEAIAYCADRDKVNSARGEDLPALPEAFSHAVRCGELVFTSDCSAIDADGDVQFPGELNQQTTVMMKNLCRALALVNATIDDVLKLNVFYLGDGTAENWSEPARIRADYFTDPGPAATGMAVESFAQPGLMTKIAVTAGAGDRCDRVFAWPANHWNWTETLPYKHGNRFGQLIHIGGQVALDSNAKVLKPDDIVEQTRIALRNIKAVLAELDADINDVVKVTTFYQGKASAEALHENLVIRSDAFKSPGPATSGIPMPHLVYQSMLIEIEVIAILDK